MRPKYMCLALTCGLLLLFTLTTSSTEAAVHQERTVTVEALPAASATECPTYQKTITTKKTVSAKPVCPCSRRCRCPADCACRATAKTAATPYVETPYTSVGSTTPTSALTPQPETVATLTLPPKTGSPAVAGKVLFSRTRTFSRGRTPTSTTTPRTSG